MADWYADDDFDIHEDMKSNKGSELTIGKGDIQTISRKQKFNTKRLVEAELVASNDVLSHLL